MISRRAWLTHSTVSAALVGLGARCGHGPGPLPEPPLVEAQSTGIDVHSHVFNARDIPIAGFVTQVVLEGQPLGQLALGPLAVLLSLIMDQSAWPPDREQQGLADGTLRPFAAPVVTASQTKEQVRSAAAVAIREMQNRSGRYAYFKARVSDHLKQARQVEHLAVMAAPDGGDAALLTFLAARAGVRMPTRGSGVGPRLQEIAPQAAADGAVAIDDEVYGVFLLASLVTERRTDLVRRLSRLPTSSVDAAAIAMYNPALVDYSLWLDEPVSPLDQQIAVMSAIAAVRGRPYLVHPWVSFCPWRQLVEPEQMALVQDAVRKKGFIGVKLYPVMGFRPIGNDNASDSSTYPDRLRALPRWGDRLDRALSDLYDWCVAEDVPITTHCSFSQYPSKEAGLRGSPREWRRVMQRPQWRSLRLNLAHLGGVWDLANPANNGWTADAIAMLAEFPNVYGDIADYDSIVGVTRDQRSINAKVLPRLSSLVSSIAAARAKLMYGTDWVMLSRAPGVDQYYSAMRDQVPLKLGVDQAAFLGQNASRFLGVDQPRRTHNTRQRLEDFLELHGISPQFLDRWNLNSVAGAGVHASVRKDPRHHRY